MAAAISLAAGALSYTALSRLSAPAELHSDLRQIEGTLDRSDHLLERAPPAFQGGDPLCHGDKAAERKDLEVRLREAARSTGAIVSTLEFSTDRTTPGSSVSALQFHLHLLGKGTAVIRTLEIAAGSGPRIYLQKARLKGAGAVTSLEGDGEVFYLDAGRHA